MLLWFPPKSSCDGIKFVANLVGNVEGGHGVDRNGLGDGVYQSLSANPKQTFASPPHNLTF